MRQIVSLRIRKFPFFSGSFVIYIFTSSFISSCLQPQEGEIEYQKRPMVMEAHAHEEGNLTKNSKVLDACGNPIVSTSTQTPTAHGDLHLATNENTDPENSFNLSGSHSEAGENHMMDMDMDMDMSPSSQTQPVVQIQKTAAATTNKSNPVTCPKAINKNATDSNINVHSE